MQNGTIDSRATAGSQLVGTSCWVLRGMARLHATMQRRGLQQAAAFPPPPSQRAGDRKRCSSGVMRRRHLSVDLSRHPSSPRATTNACVAVGSMWHSTAHVQGHGLLSGRGCLREMMTAQDVLAVSLLCRLVAQEPRRAPLLSPPQQYRMAARVSAEHSMLETLRPRVCWPQVRSDPTAGSRGKQFHCLHCPMLLAAPCSPAFRFARTTGPAFRFARKRSAEIARGAQISVGIASITILVHRNSQNVVVRNLLSR